jgi:hypothetical protein
MSARYGRGKDFVKAVACDADRKRRDGSAGAPFRAVACDADRKRRDGSAGAPFQAS